MVLRRMIEDVKEAAREKMVRDLDSSLLCAVDVGHFEFREEDGGEALYLIGKQNGDGYRAEFKVCDINLDTREYTPVEDLPSKVPLGYIAIKDYLPRLGFSTN